MAEQSVTRRLAAILAANMVGYSRLMEADETGTIARQKACRGGNRFSAACLVFRTCLVVERTLIFDF